MATTDTVRGWFHETVSNHAQRGTPGYEPRCNWGIADVAPFPAEGGGTYVEPVHPATTEAWDAYITVMNHFGETIPGAGGVNSCRNIGSSDWPSLHSYLVAVDHPPNSRMRQEFIDAVLAIRTNNGKQVFLNGAVFNDRMHNQLNCSQADLATGINWSTVKGAQMQLPAERRSDVKALLDKGVITGELTYYFPQVNQPSADLPAEVWVNVTLAAIGGAARKGLLDQGNVSASQIRQTVADALLNG